jgi:NADH-ubiquinone oxidoreductase chain 1
MFISGPILLFLLSLLLWSIIIYNYKIKLVDFMFSILFQLILNTVNIFIQLICGWAGNSKYSFIGSLRSGAQVLSYEIVFSSIVLIIVFASSTIV